MNWKNSTVQLINGLVKAAGMHCMLIMILWLLKKQPTKDLLLYSFLLEYLIDILDKKNPAFYYYYWTNQKISQLSLIKNPHRLRLAGVGGGGGSGGTKNRNNAYGHEINQAKLGLVCIYTF